MKNEYIGRSLQRRGILDKVTGRQRYVCDRKLPGMLWAKLLRSPHGSAEILRIDAEEAKNSKGTEMVLTADDIAGGVPRFGSVLRDQPILASGDVKYYGEPVAVVVADSRESAEAALKKIRVEYRPRKAVTAIEEALAPDAPVVNDFHRSGFEAGKTSHPNVLEEYEFGWGDVDSTKKRADHVLKNRYSFPMVYHFTLENFACAAALEGELLTVWTPIQHPFILRRVIAESLGIPQSGVRVVAEEIGGGFGGKGYPKIEPLAAYLAMRLKRPIKLETEFHEGFCMARRLANSTTIETGFDKDGHILFQDIETSYLAGPYAAEGPRIAQKASYVACGAYRTKNARVSCKVVKSNTTPATAFRGFGMPQLIWALERQMEAASRLVGVERAELRRRNIPLRGETLVPGDTPVDGDWREGFEKALELSGFYDAKGPMQGRGIAIGIKNPIPGSRSNALVRLLADGSMNVYVGTTEMGQGARTVMAQIAAEVLKLSPDRITIHMGDTLTVPFDQATAGSRSTVSMGTAIRNACEHVNSQLKEYVADYFAPNDPRGDEMNLENEIDLENGKIRFRGLEMTYQEFLLKYFGPFQADITGLGVFSGRKDKNSLLGGTADFWEVICTAVDLTVDESTGAIRFNKIVNVSDAGKIINPLLAESQEAGGSLIALGHALLEEMKYDADGILLNADPLNYCIPTSKDVSLRTVSSFVENEDGPGPFGSKGIGESPVIALAAAIGNALEDATGISFTSLPVTKEKLFFALKKRKQRAHHIEPRDHELENGV
ncbi:MAG: xanthine dehydrogenase family protein molybdopterin-binding subunit [Synergistaceae bacterium]|jgi:CO/xanthine dehydrogenase Mo-binding subunit|nr:xanthine dehydrogenase family protein molybdopterin-binding subunit [Synergistaceae bacterium]